MENDRFKEEIIKEVKALTSFFVSKKRDFEQLKNDPQKGQQFDSDILSRPESQDQINKINDFYKDNLLKTPKLDPVISKCHVQACSKTRRSVCRKKEMEMRKDALAPIIVKCPICDRYVKQVKINEHIDSNCALNIETLTDLSMENSLTAEKNCFPKQEDILIDNDSPSTSKENNSHAQRDFKKEPEYQDLFSSSSLEVGDIKPKENSKPSTVKTSNDVLDDVEKKRDERKRKPGVAYATMKDKGIRDLLKREGIPNNGNRAELIKRHQLWVHMYNANLDSLNPLPDSQIRRQLEGSENIKKNYKQTADATLLFGRNHNYDEQIDINTQAHYAQYREEFDLMVEDLKQKKLKNSR